MIKLILLAFVLLFTSKSFGQIASRISTTNATPIVASPTNIVFTDPFTSPTNSFKVANYNLKDTVGRKADTSFVRSAIASKVTTLALTGMSLTAGGNTVVMPSPDMSTLTPMSRQLTVNGVTHDLTSDASWSISVPAQTLQVETDPVWTSDKSAYSTTSQANLLYKPIAAPSGSVYSAGSGISVTGSVIANTAPMVTQTITGTNGLTVTATTNSFVVTQKRQETYSGTSNASGLFTVTFGTAYSVAPNIQANIINGADNQNIRITSITTTGFTVLVRTRVDVIGLLPTWNNASGLGVDVLITEK